MSGVASCVTADDTVAETTLPPLTRKSRIMLVYKNLSLKKLKNKEGKAAGGLGKDSGN